MRFRSLAMVLFPAGLFAQASLTLESSLCTLELRLPQGTEARLIDAPAAGVWRYAFTGPSGGVEIVFSCREELESIGVAKAASGKWVGAVSGRYAAVLKRTRPIRGRNWRGVLAFTDGWFGDGRNNGTQQLGVCIAPDHSICASAAADAGRLNQDFALRIFKSMVVVGAASDHKRSGLN